MLYNDGFSYSNIIAAGTTTLISGRKGVLHAINVNNPYVGTTIIKDGSGTIATIGTPSINPATIAFDARVKDGLVAISTGTPDITIIYK